MTSIFFIKDNLIASYIHMKEQQKRKIQQLHPEIEDGIDPRRCPLEEGKCNNSAHESDGRKVQQWCEQAQLHLDCGVRAKENRQLLILSLLTLYLPL